MSYGKKYLNYSMLDKRNVCAYRNLKKPMSFFKPLHREEFGNANIDQSDMICKLRAVKLTVSTIGFIDP